MNKDEIRERIWDYMEKNNLVSFPRPVYNRIPNFLGKEKAARWLYGLEEFQKARACFTAPDSSLSEARRIILKEGKTLLVALPHKVGYREIKGKNLADKATTIRGFGKYGKEAKAKVSLFIQGAVAVDLKGNRLGKGTGYGDMEYKELKERGLLEEEAKVIVLVHDCQVLEDLSSLVEPHDIKADLILTPTRLIRVK